MAAFDFVAIGEHRFLNARAVEEGAVATLLVDDVTSLRTAVDGKVRAGHERIVGHGELRLGRSSADDDGLAGGQSNRLPRHRPASYLKNDAQNRILMLEPRFYTGETNKRQISISAVSRSPTKRALPFHSSLHLAPRLNANWDFQRELYLKRFLANYGEWIDVKSIALLCLDGLH